MTTQTRSFDRDGATIRPDREAILAAVEDIARTYRSDGFGRAMGRFIALVDHDGPLADPGDLAGLTGRELVTLPGDHVGFTPAEWGMGGDPTAFAAALRPLY